MKYQSFHSKYSCAVSQPFLYNCKIKTYPDGRQNITCFSKPVFNPDKWEKSEVFLNGPFGTGLFSEKNSSEYIREFNESGIRTDNMKRAKENVFDLAFANVFLWKYMVTFTLDKNKIDRYSSEEVGKRFQQWLKDSVKRKNINYLIVGEPHKDGAIHFHGLLSDGLNYQYSKMKDKNGRKIYNIKDYPFGFARAVPIDEGTESNCCKYITKYMSKDFTKIFGKMYWAGGKDLVRNFDVEYCNMSFEELNAESFPVPNANCEVKYEFRGVTL